MIEVVAIFAKHGALGLLAVIAVGFGWITTRKNDRLTDKLIDLSKEQAAASRETTEVMRNLRETVKERTDLIRDAIRARES